jgi:hypothetical protein
MEPMAQMATQAYQRLAQAASLYFLRGILPGTGRLNTNGASGLRGRRDAVSVALGGGRSSSNISRPRGNESSEGDKDDSGDGDLGCL